MDFKLFLQGIVCWLVAYTLYYFLLKGEKPSSKENNWVGMTGASYVKLWGLVITLIIMGIISLLKSLTIPT